MARLNQTTYLKACFYQDLLEFESLRSSSHSSFDCSLIGACCCFSPAERQESVKDDESPVNVDVKHGVNVVVIFNVCVSMILKQVIEDVVGHDHIENDSAQYPNH